MNLNFNIALDIYKCAIRIRSIEERIALEYPKGEMRCPVHLSIGQEITSAVISVIQKNTDTAVSTHRSHAHYLAKGGDLHRMVAEIYGKVTGCCRGRGGSMHLTDLTCGFLGSSAIVGNSIPVGVGAALAHKLREEDLVTFVFLGDGAVEEGVFYESVNFAAVHKVPVVFICENNQYSVYTNLELRQPKNRSISGLAQSIGIKSENVDSTDPIHLYERISELVQDCRNGFGPVFIEIPTYRWVEHCGPFDDDDLGYRPKGELAKFKLKDPVSILEKQLRKFEVANVDLLLQEFKAGLQIEIDKAFMTAKIDPFPEIADVLRDVYA